MAKLTSLASIWLLVVGINLQLSFIRPGSVNSGDYEHQVIRKKRDLINFSQWPNAAICPWTAARGTDRGENSFLLFRSPKIGQDIRINFTDGRWDETAIGDLESNGFDPSKTTLFVTHGYQESGDHRWLMALRDRFDELKGANGSVKFNLFILDYSFYSKQIYWNTVSLVSYIGETLGKFFEQLRDSPMNYDLGKINLMGYSLGTHVVGHAGRSVDGMVNQLTALDPTGVCMQGNSWFSQKNSLKPTDAKFVVARHYDMNNYGSKRPIGGLDIFVNGGSNQPHPRNKRHVGLLRPNETANEEIGLKVGGYKDHGRATKHTIAFNDEQCDEIAYQCTSFEAFARGECADCGTGNSKCYYINDFKYLAADEELAKQMRHASYPRNTKMYMITGDSIPFCSHNYQVVINMKPRYSAAVQALLTKGRVFIEHGSESVAVKNKLRDNTGRFTALISRPDPIARVSELAIRVDSDDLNSNMVLRAINNIKLNYMSRVSPTDRASGSFELCFNNQYTRLVSCN